MSPSSNAFLFDGAIINTEKGGAFDPVDA